MGAKLDVEGRLVHASAADRAAEKLARCMVSIAVREGKVI